METVFEGIKISADAASQIHILTEGLQPRGLRIFVETGGCSGHQYCMSVDSPRNDDRVFEFDGAKVIIDPSSLGVLKGALIDYQGGLTGAGFRVRNPNAKRSCGCGTSFET